MDSTEVFIKKDEFRIVFSDSLDAAEMVLNKEIVDSPVINFESSDMELYKTELKLGYILCQNDLITTIYSFIEDSKTMFVKVDDIFEELEKAYSRAEDEIDNYLEGQSEIGVEPLMVIFQDNNQSMEVVKYGASLFMASVSNQITQSIIHKLLEEIN